MSSAWSPSQEELAEFLACHIFFLPKLPHSEESKLKRLELELLRFIANCTGEFIDECPESFRTTCTTISKTINLWVSLLDDDRGDIDMRKLEKAIIHMNVGDEIPVYVASQNAGIIIRRLQSKTVIEAFEVTPHAEEVLQASGCLQCFFPSHGVTVESNALHEPSLAHKVARTLTQLSTERVKSSAEKSEKAGMEMPEIREKSSPVLVTEMLLIILGSYARNGRGDHRPATIRKRVRDDAQIKNSRLPFRRCGMWITVCVVLKILAFQIHPRTGDKDYFYKNFMLFMASKLLDLCLESRQPDDVIRGAMRKVDSKAKKLGTAIFPEVRTRKTKTVAEATTHLWSHWDQTVATSKNRFENHTTQYQTFSSIRKHVEDVENRLMSGCEDKAQKSHHGKRYPRLSFDAQGIPTIPVAQTGNSLLSLLECEAWVENIVPTLLLSETALAGLKEFARCYYEAAEACYNGVAEQNGLMLLTIMEIWMKIDKVVVESQPLMADFRTEFPEDFLEPLLLKSTPELRRLNDVRTYINRRNGGARNGNPSHFAGIGCNSYSVQCVDASPKLRNLHSNILKGAEAKKASKIWEWESKQEEDHERRKGFARNGTEHSNCDRYEPDLPDCYLCSLQRPVEINIYEYPLPRNLAQQKAVVFELQLPRMYATWRDMTWMILHDIGRPGSVKSERTVRKALVDVHGFRLYEGLSSFTYNCGQTITLGSITKPVSSTHYKTWEFPVSQEQVVLDENGLEFHLTFGKDLWIMHQTEKPSLLPLCTTQLPSGPYRFHQNVVGSAGHSENETEARKHGYSNNLLPCEHSAFRMIRGGENIQLLNILNTIRDHRVSLNDEAVWTVISQALWQVGTADKDGHFLGPAHKILEEESFTTSLLDSIKEVKLRIEADCRERRSLSVLIIIALRTLYVATNDSVRNIALEVIESLREVAYCWMQDAAEDCTQTPKGTASEILMLAYLTRSTFDMDYEAVFETNRSIEIYLQCAANISQYGLRYASSLAFDLRRTIISDTRLAYKLSSKVMDLATERSSAISKSIGDILPSYAFGDQWKQSDGGDSWWLEIEATHGMNTEKVEFNALSGALLVGGQQIGSLPDVYRNTETYKALFGNETVQVVRSNYMKYKSCKPVTGMFLYFSFFKNDLIVQSGPEDGDVDDLEEFIPRQHFRDALPQPLLEETAVWLSFKTKAMHFRPWKNRWDPSSVNWTLSLNDIGNEVMQHKDGKLLHPVSGKIERDLIRPFLAIEGSSFILVTSMDEQYSIELPRFRLSFSLIADNWVCQDLNAMVDEDQSLGTFIGLQNYLVLRPLDKCSGAMNRSFIVPYGQVETRRNTYHVEVEITPEKNLRKVEYVRFHIDHHLRYVRCPSDTKASIFKSYLHAVTTGELPDPLTERTGTDESLSCLRQTLLSLSSPIPEDAIPWLEKINELTPKRDYYPVPKKRKIVQEVEWDDNLSSTSQHDDFHMLVVALVERSNMLQSIFPGNLQDIKLKSRGHADLLTRARIKNSWFRGDESLDVHPTDILYQGRDSGGWSESGKKCLQIMGMTQSGMTQSGMTQSSKFHLQRDAKISAILWPENVPNLPPMENGSFSESTIPNIACLLELPLRPHWLELYESLRSFRPDRKEDIHNLRFLLGTLAYGSNDINDIVVLAAIATSGKFEQQRTPSDTSFDLSRGFEPDESQLCKAVRDCFREPLSLTASANPSRSHKRRKLEDKEALILQETRKFVGHLIRQFPCRVPKLPGKLSEWKWLVDPERALNACKPYFEIWFANRALKTLIDRVEDIFQHQLNGVVKIKSSIRPRIPLNKSLQEPPQQLTTSLSSYFQTDSEDATNPLPDVLRIPLDIQNENLLLCYDDEIRELIEKIDSEKSYIHKSYKSNLLESLSALADNPPEVIETEIPNGISDEIKNSLASWEAHSNWLFDFIKKAVVGIDITRRNILSLIAGTSKENISEGWKKVILEYAISITMLQRLERLLACISSNNVRLFWLEAQNTGHVKWDPASIPDWLLLEIEKNVLIRPQQADVAQVIASLKTKDNTVRAIDMGFGKSFLITPMVALLLLRDSSEMLVKVVVLKPLLRPMLSSLETGLGGLIGRPICRTPLSRNTSLNEKNTEILFSEYSRCRSLGGILLEQPEDSVNLTLLAREEISTGDAEFGIQIMGRISYWKSSSRIIVDESDVVFDPKNRVVYTFGSKTALDGGSDRWVVAQQLLDIIVENVPRLGNSAEISLDSPSGGSFPKINIREGEKVDQLLDLLVKDIVEGKMPSIDFKNRQQKYVEAASMFLRQQEVDEKCCKLILEGFQEDHTTMQNIYLLRMLIAGGILAHVLRQQWMVNYGLDLGRTRIAVPYIGNGIPNPKAVFGNPDLMILLTLLSYYSAGLTDTQLKCCVQHVLKLHDLEAEILVWGRSSSTPPSVADLKKVDAGRGSEQLILQLKYNRSAINFYLSKMVFPDACKEYPQQLSCSAWNIPHEDFPNLTGFTGTSDNSSLLPSSVKQVPLKGHQHVLARQIRTILRPENHRYVCMDTCGTSLATSHLLQQIAELDEPPTRVLIDVGAQIIGRKNREVVKEWLELVPSAEAALFFDENDQETMLFQDDSTQPYDKSKYHGHLDNCLVFFDEIHSRGVDIKLPVEACAAVTLGYKLTRDKMMQACMRMRGLGHGQSVTFIATPETDQEIRKATKEEDRRLSSSHVLHWSIENTIQHILDMLSLRESQEKSHEKHETATNVLLNEWKSDLPQEEKLRMINRFRDSITEKNCATLGENYGNKPATNDVEVLVEVQTEREIQVELQQEVQVQNPPLVKACDHRLRRDVINFVKTGAIPKNSIAFVQPFRLFKKSLAKSGISTAKSNLWATSDFYDTVSLDSNICEEDFLKPVRYVLSYVGDGASLSSQILLIISQHECHELFDELLRSKIVRLHYFSPQTTLSPIFVGDSLGVTAWGSTQPPIHINHLLRFELMIFSGQLYFKSMEEYRGFMTFITVFFKDTNGKGFGSSMERGDRRFDVMRRLLDVRHEHQDFSRSHMGKICSGRVLEVGDFTVCKEIEEQEGSSEPPTKKTKVE